MSRRERDREFKKLLDTWNATAKQLLEGRTIIAARYLTPGESEAVFGGNGCGLCLVLDNKTHVYVMTDDEGNGPGALHVHPAEGEMEILPVLPP